MTRFREASFQVMGATYKEGRRSGSEVGKGKRKKGNAREMNARELERKGGRRTYSSNELDLIISVSLSLSVVVSRSNLFPRVRC